MAKYRIAEIHKLSGGGTRYICEYEREGHGTQRPTFEFGSEIAPDDAIAEMRKQIDEERKLNESLRGSGIRHWKNHPNLGKEF